MANTAKEIKLTRNGIQIYPQTITHSIADIGTGKRLSDLIPEMLEKINSIKSYSLKKDSDTQYHLEDNDGNSIGDVIKLTDSTSTLSDIKFDSESGNLIFTLSTGEEKKVDISSIVTTSQVDNETIVSNDGVLSVKEDVFLKKDSTLELLNQMNETLNSINTRLQAQETAQESDEWDEL